MNGNYFYIIMAWVPNNHRSNLPALIVSQLQGGWFGTGNSNHRACSLVGFWAGLGWLVLVCCERKTLLAG